MIVLLLDLYDYTPLIIDFSCPLQYSGGPDSLEW